MNNGTSKLKMEGTRLRIQSIHKQTEGTQHISTRRQNQRIHSKTRPSQKLNTESKSVSKLQVEKKQQGKLLDESARPPSRNLKTDKKHQDNLKFRETTTATTVSEVSQVANLSPESKLSPSMARYAALYGIHQVLKEQSKEDISRSSVEEVMEMTNKGAYHLKSFEKLSTEKSTEKLRTWKNKGEQVATENHGLKAEKSGENFRYKKNSSTNPHSPNDVSVNKWQQKQRIKRSYARDFRKGHGTATTVKTRVADTIKNMLHAVKSDPKVWAIIIGMASLLLIICCCFSSCTVISGSIVSSTSATSYASEDDDLLEVEAAYQSKETALQNQIDNTETSYPDYDEYVYNLVEIGHDPHQLASLLTALYHVYTLDKVEDILQEIFERQYSLTLTPSTETRTDSEGNSYTVSILTTTLTNTPISLFAHEFLTDEQYELYEIILACKGNKPDIFGDYLGGSLGGVGGSVDYEIPDHYLDDEDFAKVYAEAIKYLGYPYSWGGQSPSTSFDCSGFMYWIYNATGVYSHSRLTAGGYYNLCTKFDSSQRQAGDFIFFTGTSSHATISHIGMYIGDGMMIHCASAGVQIISVDSGYWASSVYVCYGRLPI